ncbi:MAG: hypothetical protein GXZ13_02500 [Synergistaceae bacterium]|nr:hypothetical protein [Synergistaceae bacterium]
MSRKTVVLISCTKAKLAAPCEARELYSASNIFTKSLNYAERISSDIYVLSAKHGLVALNDVIAPYNETLKGKSSVEVVAWGNKVAAQLKTRYDVSQTEFVILASKYYCEPLQTHLPHATLPLINLSIGKMLKKLNHLLSGPTDASTAMSYKLHRLFGAMLRLHWDDIDTIPFDSGIYIVFEKGEMYHEFDRIVRVGTHSSDGRLKGRLKDHFVRENKDGSIFRKNIGRAILNKGNHTYLSAWNKNTSKPEVVAQMGSTYNPEFQKKLEQQISKYIRENFTFVCFPVATQTERLRLEEGIIATLHSTSDFTTSSKWYGKYSPEIQIRQSGMWLREGLSATPLSENEFEDIKKYCMNAFECNTENSLCEEGKEVLNMGIENRISEEKYRELWHTIVNTFSSTPLELHTNPLNNKNYRWFSVTSDGNKIIISSAKKHTPPSSLTADRYLNYSQFLKIYPIYLRRKKGEAVSQEAIKASSNSVYWYGIMNYCDL